MWTPLDIPIEVSRNGITGIGLELWDEVSNSPLDISGLSFTCRIAKSLGEPAILDVNAEIIDSVLGQFDIIIDGSAITSEGIKEIVRLAYEVKSSEGDTVVRGPIYLIPGI